MNKIIKKALSPLFLALAFLTPGTPADASSAEDAPPSSSVLAEQELLSAYQREYAFLLAQKEALKRQKDSLSGIFGKRKAEAEATVLELEKRFSRDQLRNEALVEKVQSLEKARREEQGRSASLAAVWKKAKKTLDPTASTSELAPPSTPRTQDIVTLGLEGVRIAESASSWERSSGAFLDRSGNLVSGTIIRLGKVAAYGAHENHVSLLSPAGDGTTLREIEKASAGATQALLSGSPPSGTLLPMYLYETFGEKGLIQKPVRWVDRLADVVPALFLALLFGTVAWLFASLARV